MSAFQDKQVTHLHLRASRKAPGDTKGREDRENRSFCCLPVTRCESLDHMGGGIVVSGPEFSHWKGGEGETRTREGLGSLHRRRPGLSLCAAPLPPSVVGVTDAQLHMHQGSETPEGWPSSQGEMPSEAPPAGRGPTPTPTGVRMPLLFWKTQCPGFLQKAHRLGLPRYCVLNCAPSVPRGSPNPGPLPPRPPRN